METKTVDLSNAIYDEIEIEDIFISHNITMDIEVKNVHHYLLDNGLVSHNTISFALGAESTGEEPLYTPVVYKKLVGGGGITTISPSIKNYLERKGWKHNDKIEILEDINSFIGTLTKEQQNVVRTAVGKYSLTWEDHLNIMIAAQKYLSGAISKTLNVPKETTKETLTEIYMKAWKHGLKSVAIYRDGSKGIQVLSHEDSKPVILEVRGTQRKLNKTCESLRHGFRIGQSKGWLHIGYYPQNEDKSKDIGEIWIRMDNFGSTINGLVDCLCRAISYGLQYGVPLEKFVRGFWHMSFKPQGFTDDPEIRNAPSIPAYIVRKIGLMYFSKETLIDWGLLSSDDKNLKMQLGLEQSPVQGSPTGELCSICGTELIRTGKCNFCSTCGESTGGCE